MTRILNCIALFSALFLSPCSGEVRKFKATIEATSEHIHYSRGFLVTPGNVDLKYMEFRALDSMPTGDNGNDDTVGGDDVTDGDDGRRRLEDFVEDSTLDILVFHEPSNCTLSPKSGCDWAALGVGTRIGTGVHWCCDQSAVTLGFCEVSKNQKLNRLIVHREGGNHTFAGTPRTMTVPRSGEMNLHLRNPRLEQTGLSGNYVLLFANCNDNGRDVEISGRYAWESSLGFLPGHLFGEMYFYIVLCVLYLILLLWYAFSMRLYEDSIIPIQKWILGAVAMGLLETFFRAGDYLVWNADGIRFWFAMYVGVTVGSCKQAMSACLLVMVSLGWGVVRDDLGSTFKWIVALGVLYFLADASYEIVPTYLNEEGQKISNEEEKEFLTVQEIIEFVVDILCAIFYLWILDALNGTMQYLENMNQNVKLQRYLRLRALMLFSILFAFVWIIFGFVDRRMSTPILPKDNLWVINALYELNFLALLVGVAVLWRPNPNAKDYAYAMELPGVGDDEENELEMTASVPSALDENDEEDEGENGMKTTGYKDGDVADA